MRGAWVNADRDIGWQPDNPFNVNAKAHTGMAVLLLSYHNKAGHPITLGQQHGIGRPMAGLSPPGGGYQRLHAAAN